MEPVRYYLFEVTKNTPSWMAPYTCIAVVSSLAEAAQELLSIKIVVEITKDEVKGKCFYVGPACTRRARAEEILSKDSICQVLLDQSNTTLDQETKQTLMADAEQRSFDLLLVEDSIIKLNAKSIS